MAVFYALNENICGKEYECEDGDPYTPNRKYKIGHINKMKTECGLEYENCVIDAVGDVGIKPKRLLLSNDKDGRYLFILQEFDKCLDFPERGDFLVFDTFTSEPIPPSNSIILLYPDTNTSYVTSHEMVVSNETEVGNVYISANFMDNAGKSEGRVYKIVIDPKTGNPRSKKDVYGNLLPQPDKFYKVGKNPWQMVVVSAKNIKEAKLGLGVDGEEISADDPRIFIGASVTLGEDDKGNLIFADDGTKIKWSFEGEGGSLEVEETTTSYGFSSNIFHTTTKAGDTFKVFAKLTELIYEGKAITFKSEIEETPQITVKPGSAAKINYSVDDNKLPSDQNTTTKITITAYDSSGNLIKDGSEIIWEDSGVGEILSSDEITTDGQANLVLKSGWLQEKTQEVVTQIDDFESSTTVENLAVRITLSSSESYLEVGSSKTALITARVSDSEGKAVLDGTPIDGILKKAVSSVTLWLLEE